MARYADMCNIFGDPATVAHKVDVLRGHCKDVGRDPSEVTVSRLSTLVLTESDEETQATRDFLKQMTGEEPTPPTSARQTSSSPGSKSLPAAGVDYFVFNVPTGTAETVRRVGQTLVSRFSD